jgi:hypothetical protein
MAGKSSMVVTNSGNSANCPGVVCTYWIGLWLADGEIMIAIGPVLEWQCLVGTSKSWVPTTESAASVFTTVRLLANRSEKSGLCIYGATYLQRGKGHFCSGN